MMAARTHKPSPERRGQQVAKRSRSPRKAEAKAPVKLNPPAIDAGMRRAMTAEAAYYRAERRGFAPGQELDDWFAAEAEIERATAPHRGDEPTLCGD
jgi:Protein of unknown function (DUF2934)